MRKIQLHRRRERGEVWAKEESRREGEDRDKAGKTAGPGGGVRSSGPVTGTTADSPIARQQLKPAASSFDDGATTWRWCSHTQSPHTARCGSQELHRWRETPPDWTRISKGNNKPQPIFNIGTDFPNSSSVGTSLTL